MSLKKIGTIKSSTTPRVLPAIEGRPRMEVTAVGVSGELLGTAVFGSFATYQAEMKPGGHWQGECQIQALLRLLMEWLHSQLLELGSIQRMEQVHGKVFVIFKLLLHHYQN